MVLELDLLSNSVDYVGQSLELAFVADEFGEHRSRASDINKKTKWKTAFVLLIQGMELLLKYRLSLINEVLIYSNIDSKNLYSENLVSVTNAIQRILNIDKEFFGDNDLEFIRKCIRDRNRFVHYDVKIYTEEIKNKYARLIYVYCNLYKKCVGKILEPNTKMAKEGLRNNLHFYDNLTIFRGREVSKNNLDEIKKEISVWGKQDYFYSAFGEKVPRIKYGDERLLGEGYAWDCLEYEYCDDCGAAIGEYHMPRCDLEVCPICKGQLLSCECQYDKKLLYDELGIDENAWYYKDESDDLDGI